MRNFFCACLPKLNTTGARIDINHRGEWLASIQKAAWCFLVSSSFQPSFANRCVGTRFSESQHADPIAPTWRVLSFSLSTRRARRRADLRCCRVASGLPGADRGQPPNCSLVIQMGDARLRLSWHEAQA